MVFWTYRIFPANPLFYLLTSFFFFRRIAIVQATAKHRSSLARPLRVFPAVRPWPLVNFLLAGSSWRARATANTLCPLFFPSTRLRQVPRGKQKYREALLTRSPTCYKFHPRFQLEECLLPCFPRALGRKYRGGFARASLPSFLPLFSPTSVEHDRNY